LNSPNLLVDPAWLEPGIGGDRLRILDLRDAASHAEGHIPTAVHVGLGALTHHRNGCDNMLLPAGEFEALMSSLGITSDDMLVAYDDHWGLPSSRLIWSLHRYGHRSAAILNGGWDRWTEEQRPSDRTPAANRTGVFQARNDADVQADASFVRRAVTKGDAVLLDTRSPAEFEAGHVPGAISWDWFNAVPAQSWDCARDTGELRAELASLGVQPSQEIVVYCRTGMRAAHSYVVLRHIGFENVRLFDGSWQEWSRTVQERPDKQADL
jgi:thiosulfate/3-mercaptopyruvate sulfurtransferase